MKIICTTVVRAAKQGDIHGGLYVVDIDEGKLLHHAPYEMDFINDNERGGERGLRGICVLPDRIIVGDSAGFIELDKNTYEIKRTHQDRDYFRRLIPKLFDEGEIGHIYQQMLINRQKKDTKEHNRNLLNNTLGSWIEAGKKLSLDRLNNVNLKKILNFGGK